MKEYKIELKIIEGKEYWVVYSSDQVIAGIKAWRFEEQFEDIEDARRYRQEMR